MTVCLIHLNSSMMFIVYRTYLLHYTRLVCRMTGGWIVRKGQLHRQYINIVWWLVTKSPLTYLSVDRETVEIFSIRVIKGNVVENRNQEWERPDTLWFRIRGTQWKVNGCHFSTVFVHYSNAKQANFNQHSAPHRWVTCRFLNMFIRFLMYY